MNIEQIKTQSNTTFVGFSNDYLFNLIKQGNEFPDSFLLDAINKYVNKDSICIDIGANLGYVSLYLADKCKKLYSFEPQLPVYLQLCANLFLNQKFNVIPYNLACHSKTCNLDFANFQSGWTGTKNVSNIEEVKSFGAISLEQKDNGEMKAVRLDEIIPSNQKIDFIKVDAQGADVDVIIGAEKIIIKDRPIIVFEYEDDMSRNNYNRQLSDLELFIAKFNYNKIKLFEENYILIPVEKV